MNTKTDYGVYVWAPLDHTRDPHGYRAGETAQDGAGVYLWAGETKAGALAWIRETPETYSDNAGNRLPLYVATAYAGDLPAVESGPYGVFRGYSLPPLCDECGAPNASFSLHGGDLLVCVECA